MSNPPLSDIDFKNKIAWVLTTLESLQNENFEISRNLAKVLRVVQTEVILFLKSLSERGGSDMERLWI